MKNEKQPKKIKYKDVTALDVKACKGYKHISNEMAQRIADTIRVYTEVIYNCFKEGKFAKQEANVMSLTSQENKKAA